MQAQLVRGAAILQGGGQGLIDEFRVLAGIADVDVEELGLGVGGGRGRGRSHHGATSAAFVHFGALAVEPILDAAPEDEHRQEASDENNSGQDQRHEERDQVISLMDVMLGDDSGAALTACNVEGVDDVVTHALDSVVVGNAERPLLQEVVERADEFALARPGIL